MKSSAKAYSSNVGLTAPLDSQCLRPRAYHVWQSCRPLSRVTKRQNFEIMSGSLTVSALGWSERSAYVLGGGGGLLAGDAVAVFFRWMWAAAVIRATAGLGSDRTR